MIKTAKDILLYALHKDFANKNGSRSTFLNIPKNNDYTELLDAISEITNGGKKNGILFLATNMTSYNLIAQSEYDTIYIYDILQKKISPDGTYQFVSELNLSNKYNHIVLQSCDIFDSNTIFNIENIFPTKTKIYICYDSCIIKKFLGSYISSLMWRFSNYAVQKIGRDKNNTSIMMYNIKNKLRERKFDMIKFADELVSKDPYLRVIKQKDLDIFKYYNINTPIITPHTSMIIPLTKEIRTHMGLDTDHPFLPSVGEWLVLHAPINVFINKLNKYIVLPLGYRFKIKSIIPLNDEKIANVTFDHQLSDRTTVELSLNISLNYLEYLHNGYVEKEYYNDNIAYAYYGYVLKHTHVLDQTYDSGIVIFDYNNCYSKDDLYTTLVPILNTMTIFIISRDRINIEYR